MRTSTAESSPWRKATAIFMGGLLSALVMGVVLMAAPASAICPTPPCTIDPSTNQPPTVSTDTSTMRQFEPGQYGIEIVDGQSGNAMGTYSDPDGNNVTLSASFGTVEKTPREGIWMWSSHPGANSPGLVRQVTITASDGIASTTTSFWFIVDYGFPNVSLTSPQQDALVRGTISLTANATDLTGIQRVDFSVRGANVGRVSPSTGFETTFNTSLNTTTFEDGPAKIGARAIDWWNVGMTSERTVTIDNTAPTIDERKPARRASAKANVTAHFVEAVGMDEASVEAVDGVTGLPTTFVLKKGTKVVPATVSYDPNTQIATLDPARKLRSGARYVAAVTTAAKDEAGNPLAADDTWSFRVK